MWTETVDFIKGTLPAFALNE